MFDDRFFIFFGSAFSFLLIGFWFVFSKRLKRKESPPSLLKRALIKLGRIFVTIVMAITGPVFLLVSAATTVDILKEWNTLRLLEEKGEHLQVPLIEVTQSGRGRYTFYRAVYEYKGSIHAGAISEYQYHDLLDKDSIEIMAYSGKSRIVGTGIRDDVFAILIPAGTLGFLFTGITGAHTYRMLRNAVSNPSNLKRATASPLHGVERGQG